MRTSTISGFVRDDTGAALSSAMVSVTGPTSISVSSGSDGSYSVGNLRPGVYSIGVSKPPYNSSDMRLVTVPPDAANVDFVLQRTPCGTLVTSSHYTSYFGGVVVSGQQVGRGTLVEAFSPRGDRVGCFQITSPGIFGYMRVYGEETGTWPTIPGMRAGELVAFKVDGSAAGVEGSAQWRDDKSTHLVNLGDLTPENRVYLPLLLRAD
jgi:hypothetical protein